ncbi:TraK family protein [Pseudomonas tussilaginis]|uniref:TraK family protein n=1 Tax=Pseudomonas putida TaxID=303 RepID=UPI0023644169|nr:TraK family protein [Pseudomonas putida]MDD1975438.1 TraK family protein [Pseudomonas putida]
MNHQHPTVEAAKLARDRDGLVSFVAVMEEVKALVNKGYPLVRIYKTFEDHLDIGYTQFTKYVARHIKQGKPIF